MENLPNDHFVTISAYTPTVYRDQYSSIDPTSAALSQAGKVVIITGASAGIGARGLAPAFAKATPKAIVLVGRDASRLQATEEALRDITTQVEYLSVPTDLSSLASVDALFETVKAKYGHADVLINNAGTFTSEAPIAHSDPSEWWLDFEVNVKGTYLVTRGFLRLLGSERQATIVTMSSGLATMVAPTMSAYSISKLGTLKVAEYVAAEYPNVNSVILHPGNVLTNMVVDSFRRFSLDTPELVGGTGVWLATDAARFLSGRFVFANWSVDDLVKRKDEITEGDDLKVVYQGKFGLEQFK
ncbi:hypothetical protein A1O3_08749 [Capronia epimyces CBS 606.96]|uniref:Oxidoreductase n=1 Tax=Capronia epimyces CBS 606.96 TaxID=1182542 RepID=W9XG76_9EURO|nr:uncharacterized protein A1O3_08749 [Capronia epimyces CBS 606.96]EXJ79248.1 hypothetical protein A1O3_08749 [Capronia epimyces CBS 606.96]